MIYLDYSATTPVSFEVLDTISKVTKEFIGNPNSLHSLGKKSYDLLESATKQIADILNISPNEIIYTSGATEANNMAIIGSVLANHKKGKHIMMIWSVDGLPSRYGVFRSCLSSLSFTDAL